MLDHQTVFWGIRPFIVQEHKGFVFGRFLFAVDASFSNGVTY